MNQGTQATADSSLGIGIVAVTVIVVLSVFMAPAAHWITYVLTGLAAACAFTATTVLLRRRRQNNVGN